MRRHSLLPNALVMLVITGAPAICSATDGVQECTLHLGVSETAPLSTIQFTIDYGRVQGTFAGSGFGAKCEGVTTGASLTANDQCDGDYATCQWNAPNRRLTVALLGGADGFTGASEIARCTYESVGTPAAADFTIDSEAAALVDGTPNPAAHVSILGIDCAQ